MAALDSGYVGFLIVPFSDKLLSSNVMQLVLVYARNAFCLRCWLYDRLSVHWTWYCINRHSHYQILLQSGEFYSVSIQLFISIAFILSLHGFIHY